MALIEFKDRTVRIKENRKTAYRVLDPSPSQKIINHSPNGFRWGYGGSGPAQLALALLLHFSTRKAEENRKQFALAHYQDFKWEVIAELKDGTYSSTLITDWIKKAEEQNGRTT